MFSYLNCILVLFFTNPSNSFRAWTFVNWEMNPFQGYRKAILGWDRLAKIKNKKRKLCFCEIVHFLTVAFESFKNKLHQFDRNSSFTRPIVELCFNSRTLFRQTSVQLLQQMRPSHSPKSSILSQFLLVSMNTSCLNNSKTLMIGTLSLP